MGTVPGMLKIGSCHRALAFRCGKLLDLLAKFSDGFPVIEVPLMPCCVILRRTTHHHDKPFSVKITKVVNKNIEAFSAKLVVWYRCHDCSSIIKSTGLAIRILPNLYAHFCHSFKMNAQIRLRIKRTIVAAVVEVYAHIYLCILYHIFGLRGAYLRGKLPIRSRPTASRRRSRPDGAAQRLRQRTI